MGSWRADDGPRGQHGLRRRDVLRLAAGLPLVLGLPRLVWSQEPDPCPETPPGGPAAIDDALARARGIGRPVLLVVLPGREGEQELLARLQRTARRLHDLLVEPAERTRLLLANLVVVVGPRAALSAAVPALASVDRGLWLLAPNDGTPARAIDAALDGDDAAAARLLPALLAAVLPPEGCDSATARTLLAPRVALERAALGAAREQVERDLAALAEDAFAAREAASKRLAGRADALAATLTALALGSTDAETRSRALDLVVDSVSDPARVEPVGARWDRWRGGCGRNDPYEEELSRVRCGMAQPGPAKAYLRLLGT